MRRATLPTAAALVLLVAASASPRTLASPPIEGGGPGEGFVCLVLNAGGKPLREAVAEVRESGGALLSASVPLDGLAPGEIEKIATLATGTPRRAYCAVDGKVSAKTLRITLCVAGASLLNCVTGP